MIKNARFNGMERMFLRISLLLLVGLLPAVAAAQQNPPNAVEPTGQFEDVWIEHNVTTNGRKGMVFHAKFNVKSMLNKPCRLVATFQYVDGKPLKGSEPAYTSSEGQVIAIKNFTPQYASATFNDFQLFMPYAALNMGSGKSTLRVRLSIYDVNAKKFFARTAFIDFNFTQ